ncbi:MAG: hypothetical protein ACLFWL_16295 [Candidatus Brocadiia bacterium]
MNMKYYHTVSGPSAVLFHDGSYGLALECQSAHKKKPPPMVYW